MRLSTVLDNWYFFLFIKFFSCSLFRFFCFFFIYLIIFAGFDFSNLTLQTIKLLSWAVFLVVALAIYKTVLFLGLLLLFFFYLFLFHHLDLLSFHFLCFLRIFLSKHYHFIMILSSSLSCLNLIWLLILLSHFFPLCRCDFCNLRTNFYIMLNCNWLFYYFIVKEKTGNWCSRLVLIFHSFRKDPFFLMRNGGLSFLRLTI
jgi:hypothetical protein